MLLILGLWEDSASASPIEPILRCPGFQGCCLHDYRGEERPRFHEFGKLAWSVDGTISPPDDHDNNATMTAYSKVLKIEKTTKLGRGKESSRHTHTHGCYSDPFPPALTSFSVDSACLNDATMSLAAVASDFTLRIDPDRAVSSSVESRLATWTWRSENREEKLDASTD